MTTALVLIVAALVGLLGLWGTWRLLGRLALAPPERLALALALFPAALGLAAFWGLLLGRPGPLLPAAVAVALALAGAAFRPLALSPLPLRGRGPWGNRGRGEAAQRRGPMVGNPMVGRTGGEGVLSCLLVYAAGALGTTLLTPVSGGALRIGDWVAHWFLVLVYLGQPLPDLRTFINRVGDFGVISRPPLYNLEGGLLAGALQAFGVTGEVQFWPFQLLTPLLALPVAAAAVLWARNVGGVGAARIVVPLVGLSPFLLQNASYPWSKMVAGGLVLLFLAMIRVAALTRQPSRTRQGFVLAALCAGLGYLAHQTTIFYVAPTLLWLVVRRPRPLFRRSVGWTVTTWVIGGLVGLAAFAPWQGWVLASYGLQATVEANPAWFGADVSDTFGDWLLKGIVAGIGTLVPLPLLGAVARGALPTVDQVLRVQLALLAGALGASGCWLLVHAGSPSPVKRGLPGWPGRGGRHLPWLALVMLGGFLGQVMLQPNWHDTGDAAESMTPIVVLGLAYVAREAGRLRAGGRRLFFGLVMAETTVYLVLWLWWAFSPAWTRDPNTILASRYELLHLRSVWGPATVVGGVLLAAGLGTSAVLLWRALAQAGADRAQAGSAAASADDEVAAPVS